VTHFSSEAAFDAMSGANEARPFRETRLDIPAQRAPKDFAAGHSDRLPDGRDG
jgi:hypothetical protein